MSTLLGTLFSFFWYSTPLRSVTRCACPQLINTLRTNTLTLDIDYDPTGSHLFFSF